MHSRKLEELIVYLSAHSGVTNLGLTKLWKLIYFVEARALRDLGEGITGSEFIKYQHGPVPSRGEKHLRLLVKKGEVHTTPRQVGGVRLNEVKAARKPDPRAFSKEERHLINRVCKELGQQTATVLSNLSHQEPAWHYAEMMQKLSPELILYGAREDPDEL